jgi:hypothetical protein
LKRELAFKVVPELVVDVGDAFEEDRDANVKIDVVEEETSLPARAVEDDSMELDVVVEVMTGSPPVVGVAVVVLELETVFSTAFPQIFQSRPSRSKRVFPPRTLWDQPLIVEPFA